MTPKESTPISAIRTEWLNRERAGLSCLGLDEAVVNIGIFWTRAVGLFPWLIARVTGCEWSHAGLLFDLWNRKTMDSRRVYFEASFGSGFVGPLPWADLEKWADAAGRRLHCQVFGKLNWAQAKLDLCERLVGLRSYYAWQLVLMYCFERFGWRVPRSPDRVVCSEIVARILYPEADLRDPDRTFDEVTPCSIYRRLVR